MTAAPQLHTLLNLVVTEDRTGILATRTAFSEPIEGLSEQDRLHSFSFLFRKGHLVSARLGPHLDCHALAHIPSISLVAKARWTPMRVKAITVTDNSLSTAILAELVHNATALPTRTAVPQTPLAAGLQRDGQILYRRAQKVFSEVFGEMGHSILLEVVNKMHPDASPIGFLHQCIDTLAPYMGMTNATNLMVPPK